MRSRPEDRTIPLAKAARQISRETIYSPETVMGFLRSAFREYTPILRECTCLTPGEIELAKAIINQAVAMNRDPDGLIPKGGLRSGADDR